MNSRQLQYAILLSQVRNFSQVAEQLDISQPALSKQILNLEKELGVRLFNRDTLPLTLTPAGEYFVREAKELLYKEDQVLRTMDRFRSGEEGLLTIGISPFRSLYLLQDVIKKLRQQYPSVKICLKEESSDKLRADAAEGKYDFAVVNLPVDESLLEIRPLEQDKLVLVVPKSLMNSNVKAEEGQLPRINLAQCGALPFITVGKWQELGQLFDRLCTRVGILPRVVAEVKGLTTVWSLVHAGIGAAVLPLQFVAREATDDTVQVYSLSEEVPVRQPVVVTRRGQYLSEYAQFAIDFLTNQK